MWSKCHLVSLCVYICTVLIKNTLPLKRVLHAVGPRTSVSTRASTRNQRVNFRVLVHTCVTGSVNPSVYICKMARRRNEIAVEWLESTDKGKINLFGCSFWVHAPFWSLWYPQVKQRFCHNVQNSLLIFTKFQNGIDHICRARRSERLQGIQLSKSLAQRGSLTVLEVTLQCRSGFSFSGCNFFWVLMLAMNTFKTGSFLLYS